MRLINQAAVTAQREQINYNHSFLVAIAPLKCAPLTGECVRAIIATRIFANVYDVGLIANHQDFHSFQTIKEEFAPTI
jgi:hypothetical protein